MADVGSEAGHLWRWYFGTYDLRMSKDFWQVVLERFNGWQPPHFFAIFLGVIFLSLTLDRNPRALMALSASIVGFFAGWLVFANVYKIHDYYQLPAAIIVFLAFAIVLGSLIESLDARTWMSKRFISSIQILPLMPFLYQAVAADALNHKERTDFWRAVEYLLRDDDIFLYVAENTNNPAIGGQVSTKFKGISPASLEDNCSDYLGAFKAVLFEGSQSICLDSAKVRAKHFIRDEGKVFLYVEDAQQPIEEASRNSY
jgi:hypothetical protein